MARLQDDYVELDPKKVEKLMRCDICNKLVCICKPITNPIGFRLPKTKKKRR